MPASDIRKESQSVGSDHREFALREIHHVGSAEDQHEAERDQRVNRADAYTGEK